MSSRLRRVALISAAALGVAPIMSIPAMASPDGDNVVINEFYGRGGSANAPFTHKFVELYNPTGSAIDLSTMSLQYIAAAGTSSNGNVALEGEIAPGGYFLVQLNSNGTNGVALPTPDQIATFAPSGTTGTIALVNGTANLTNLENPLNAAGDDRFIDVVGFGQGGVNETAPAAYPGKNGDQGSISRTGGADTDNNSADFTYSETVTPQNSGTAPSDPDPVDPDPTDPDPVDPDPVDPAELTPIAEIQGPGDETPLAGQTVTTRGVVTGTYPTGNFNGFYIQTPGTGAAVEDASHGIFVYTRNAPTVAIGDYVEVAGTAGEYNGLTQLTNPTITKVEETVDAPTPFALTEEDLIAKKEQLEGMLVDASGITLTVTDNYSTNRYGQVALAIGDHPLWQETDRFSPVDENAEWQALVAFNNEHMITLDDGSSWDYTSNNTAKNDFKLPYLSKDAPTRVGAKVTSIKPMIIDYRFQWNLQPTTHITGDNYLEHITFENTRTEAPGDLGGDISIASFNVLNYFATLGEEQGGSSYKDREGNPITVNSGPTRGAWTEESFLRQQGKIVAAINQLDASIVGLEEIENSAAFGKDRDFALDNLVAALNAAGGNWEAVASPDALPADEDVIRLAFIYNPDKVDPVDDSVILLNDPAFGNAREPLAQKWKAKDSEKTFVTVTNHFKSKGSGTDDGTNQGNANPDRIAQATALRDFVADKFAGEPVFLMGDFNSYTAEQPLDVLENAGYTNLVVDAGKDQYTYTYSKRVGSLDHILANEAAKALVTDTEVWNINSVEAVAHEYSRYNYNVADLFEPNTPWRSSDHDPVKVGLKITKPVVDKTDLEAAIEEAHEANTTGKTDESVLALADALVAGEAVFADPDATQDEVDAAAKAIRDAIAGLTDKPVDPVDPVNPVDPVDPVKPVDPVDPVKPVDPKPVPAPEKGNLFYIVNDWVSTIAHKVISFGRPGDRVFIGDWDGDGKDTIGLRRGRMIFLDNTLTGGDAEHEFAYGKPGDEVIVGDWDGDGKDSIAVRRGNTFYVKNDFTAGNADYEFTYGRAGDEVFVGDWDGDGKDTIAVRRGATFYAKDSLTAGNADHEFTYGRAGDEVFVGDWDGDGKDTFAVRRGAKFFVKNSLTPGHADIELVYGRPGDTAYAGDWDGDGKDTLAVNRYIG